MRQERETAIRLSVVLASTALCVAVWACGGAPDEMPAGSGPQRARGAVKELRALVARGGEDAAWPIRFSPAASSADDEITRALRTLAAVGKAATGAVQTLLEDEDPKLRCMGAAASEALGSGAHSLVPTLEALLQDENFSVAHQSALALTAIAEDGARTTELILDVAARFPGPLHQRLLLEPLGRLGAGAHTAAPLALSLLAHAQAGDRHHPGGDEGLAVQAAETLSLISAADERVCRRMIDAMVALQSPAIGASIRRMGVRAVSPDLTVLLGHENPNLRLGALYALQQTQDQEAFSRIVDLLDDPWRLVRRAAIEAAAHQGERAIRAVPILVRRLRDSGVSHDERVKIVAALLKIGEPSSVIRQALLDVKASSSGELRAAVDAALAGASSD